MLTKVRFLDNNVSYIDDLNQNWDLSNSENSGLAHRPEYYV